MSLDRNDVIQLTHELIQKHQGIACNKNFFRAHWKVSVNDCGKSVLGYCDLINNSIVVSSRIILAADFQLIQDVVRHEVVHALVGMEISKTGRRMAHGKTFKEYCKILGTPAKSILPVDISTWDKIQSGEF